MICSLAAGPRTVITGISICTPSPYAFVYHTVNLCTTTTLKVSSSSLGSRPPLAPRRRYRTVRNEDGGVLLKLRIQYNTPSPRRNNCKNKGPKKRTGSNSTYCITVNLCQWQKIKQSKSDPNFFPSRGCICSLYYLASKSRNPDP